MSNVCKWCALNLWSRAQFCRRHEQTTSILREHVRGACMSNTLVLPIKHKNVNYPAPATVSIGKHPSATSMRHWLRAARLFDLPCWMGRWRPAAGLPIDVGVGAGAGHELCNAILTSKQAWYIHNGSLFSKILDHLISHAFIRINPYVYSHLF